MLNRRAAHRAGRAWTLSSPAAGALSPRSSGRRQQEAPQSSGQEVHMRLVPYRRLALAACSSVIAVLIAACGSSSTTGGGTTATVPSDLSISSFDASFSYMPKLGDLVKAGHGKVGVLLPDTTTSGRYVSFDLPYLTKALQQAGYSASDFTIDNAQGQEQQELSQAQALVTAGASVLIMDPISS